MTWKWIVVEILKISLASILVVYFYFLYCTSILLNAIFYVNAVDLQLEINNFDNFYRTARARRLDRRDVRVPRPDRQGRRRRRGSRHRCLVPVWQPVRRWMTSKDTIYRADCTYIYWMFKWIHYIVSHMAWRDLTFSIESTGWLVLSFTRICWLVIGCSALLP